MIQNHYLFPQFYICKVPYCDDCNIQLLSLNQTLLSDPPMQMFKCTKCGREYSYRADELQGEWKWRAL